MLRQLTVLMLSWLVFFPSPGLIALQQPTSAAEAEARLRARVADYWSFMQQGAYSKATELVRASDRDYFLTVKKTSLLSYTIDRIALDDRQTHAQVDLTVKKPVPRLSQPVAIKVENTWELIDGEWFITFEQKGFGFFESNQPGGQVRNPTSLQINPSAGAAAKVSANDADRSIISIGANESPLSALYDFGQTFSGNPVSYKFRFKNIGTTPLKIQALQTTDPALSIVLVDSDNNESSKRRFNPSEIGEVLVTVNSRGLEGPIQYHGSILFEGRKTPLTLGIKGSLNKNFTLTPPRAELDITDKTRAEVTIFNETGTFLTFKGLEQVPAFLDAALSKGGLAPHDQAALQVSIKPKAKIPSEGYQGTVLIRVDLDRQTAIPVPVHVRGTHP